MKSKLKSKGLIYRGFTSLDSAIREAPEKSSLFSNKRSFGVKKNDLTGFTLIELLVVVAIIALLSSIALIALVSARQKSRDVKRLSDMTQMNTALELFYTYNKGYPSEVSGQPQNMIPTFISSMPIAPGPGDGACDSLTQPWPVPPGVGANTYYYVPSGTPDSITGAYPDYAYYFCLGNLTGNFPGGQHILTPKGVR